MVRNSLVLHDVLRLLCAAHNAAKNLAGSGQELAMFSVPTETGRTSRKRPRKKRCSRAAEDNDNERRTKADEDV